MGRALFTAVTGLKAQQTKLDIVANNIANVNTTGYRSSRILFQDLFSQTLSGPSAPAGQFGGTNPRQVGLGVQVASIDVNHGQGSLVTTGINSDLAIQGNGFFILSDGLTSVYTRDGSFTINSVGTLIDPATGLRVQGYTASPAGVIDAVNTIPGDITIPLGQAGFASATTEAEIVGNLNARTRDGEFVVRNIEVFDSLGTARNVELTFTKTPNPNEWTWEATFDNGGGPATVGSGTLTFDTDGTVQAGSETGAISITAADLGSEPTMPVDPLAITLDFSTITQLTPPVDPAADPAAQPPSNITLNSQDGFPLGVLQSFSIGANGQIIGVFTNDRTRVIAQVALAAFANVGGLTREGNNAFRQSPASGLAQIGTPGTGGRGSVNGGVLESSNVDLGTEFSELIITQRAFQANSRTITAADTLLQEAVNLVR
ncbi:MAG: flagellar hook protein FlgE [Candidatus Hydrogenedentes bacterium]|nr:flagellar hook protein FlgE [Candidatus Hydrogenedentota bacterium]